MSTQTPRPVRKPSNNRSAKSNRRYSKQTAHVEARRDGKPLIFGWGKHLSHTEKVRIQRRATWGMAALIVLLLGGVVVGAWINFNILIPGLPISKVNGHSIPQSEFREMVAVKTQISLNELYGPNGLTTRLTRLQKQDAQATQDITNDNNQISSLNKQIKALPSGPSSQRTSLNNQLTTVDANLTTATKQDQSLQSQMNDLSTNQIPDAKNLFIQSQIGNDSANWLVDDELIREWLATQSIALQNKINPTTTQVNHDVYELLKNMPTSNGYNTVFSSMGISDDNIRAMMTIIDRRNNMQNYLSPQIKSPSYQVLARQIVLPTQAKANQILQDLQKGQNFGQLASKNSADSNTANKGGDLGWLTQYQYIDPAGNINGPSVIDNWLFDPSRTLNETSPILYGNSSYYIVQITNIDPSQTVSSSLLSSLKLNALVDWLQDRGGNGIPLSGQNITRPDQSMIGNSENYPPNNILPTSAPVEPTPTSGTAPGSAPAATPAGY